MLIQPACSIMPEELSLSAVIYYVSYVVLFVVYLTTLSVAQTMNDRMINELEKI
jgi:hypothetical protein